MMMGLLSDIDCLYDIDSRRMLLTWLHNERGKLVCTDEKYSYYHAYIYGRLLMYRQNTLRPDGRKCYMLTDALARTLGFEDLYSMKFRLTTIRYWKLFVSVERLRIAFDRYDGKQDKYRKMADVLGV